MSYEVLARRLRPRGFDALIGQEHVVRALRHGLDHDRLHHAYLFTGTRGVGKTTIARILARCLNCEQGVSANPCGECSICEEVSQNRFVDLIEVDAASRTGVSDTRDLLDNAQYLPTRGRYKVYLIDEVHMLSTAAFNALLKTLEEPPPHVKFLLATTDPKKVPVTVLSRCIQFQLKNLSALQIEGYLANVLAGEDVRFEQEALELIGRAARGSMRDALSITDQAVAYGAGALNAADVAEMLGLVGRDEIGALLDALAGGDAAHVLDVVRDLAARSVDFSALLAELTAALHAQAVDLALGRGQGPFTAETVQLYYQIALMGYKDLPVSPDAQTCVEMTLLRMLAFAPEPDSAVPPAGRDTLKSSQSDALPPAQGSSAATAWHALVDKLNAGGLVRMLFEHAILEKDVPAGDGEIRRMTLLLDKRHDTLYSEGHLPAIHRALSDALGEPVEVRVSLGEPASETPARRRERIARERQEQAEESLRSDVNVQSLLSAFDGRLETIRPV